MNFATQFRHVAIVALRAGLIVVLLWAGWKMYRQLPPAAESPSQKTTTNLQIVMRQPPDGGPAGLNVAVDFYPVDIVAVRHEYFTERRAGKPFWDFFKERMKGRSPVRAQLDNQGHGVVSLSPGTWWLHATLPGDEELEWQLPVSVDGGTQVIELTSQNAYTRSKTF